MKKRLEVTLSVDAHTGEVTAVRNSFDELDRKVGTTNKSLSNMKGKFLAIVSVTAGIYGLIKAFSFLVESGYDYNKSMDDSTAKLTAMISASKGYVTVSGEQVNAEQRHALIAAEAAQTMEMLKTVNAQTAMGMSELIDIYALAKPGMDRYKWAVSDQIEIVKLASNTASNFSMTSEELSSGIDDLAAGTWEASSGFGKMMKAVGVSKEEFKAAGDKVAYLKEKLKETGVAQDTMSVATSNFKVAWDNMAGQVTQPIFNGVKEALKTITAQMNKSGPGAMQVFADALVDMVNVGVKSMGFLAKVINQVIGSMQIAYSGYQKYAGLVMSGDISKVKAEIAELKRIKKEGDYGLFSNQSRGVVNAEIRSLLKKIESYKKWNDVRREGDKNYEEALKRTEAINKLISRGVKKFTLQKGVIKDPIQEAIKPAEQLAYKLNNVNAEYTGITNASKKAEKALQNTQKKAQNLKDDLEDAASSFATIFQQGLESILKGDFAGGLADIMGNAMQIATSSVAGAFSKGLGNIFSGAGSFTEAFNSLNPMSFIGSAISVIGGMLSNTLSEAEIKAATGRREFESTSLTTITELLSNNPLLPLTKNMLTHLNSMDDKFGSIANAISSSANGLDINGSDFQSKASYGFLGFSSSQSELLGAGIEFGQQTVAGFLEGVDAIGYEAVKVTSSSFWGLIKSEKIKEVAKDLPQSLKDDISQAFGEGITSVMEAVKVLGFNTDAIQAKLDQYVLDLGKLNFKDLSAQEQSQALSNAMSEQLDSAFSQAIGAIASPQNIQALNDMARAGESYTETLVRAAVQHETIRTQLSLFGQTVTDFATSDALIKAAGGLDAFKNAMSIFTENFFSEEEQRAMQQQQLKMALMIHNIALPASKAQFKALVLETQQKIISVKSNIETMKAGIRADIAANNYKREADESYARSAISTANNVNRAAILIGTSANDMIEAAKGAGVAAQNIDYTDAYTRDIGLQALETELSNLEGIYGALMQNMGAFSEYYNGVETAAQNTATDAQEKLNDTRQTQIELINKEIELRNQLNSAIASMKESVYNSFEQLLGKDVPQLLNGLTTAINNKDYAGVSGAFNDYTTGLSNTAGSKEEYLRGVIGANAMVQSVQGQAQMSLLEASLATEANTAETAYLARIALGIQEDTVASTEKDNKLDRNNDLLMTVVQLLEESLKNDAKGTQILEETLRDALAKDLRERYAA